MKDLDFAERKERIDLLEAERRHIVKQGMNDAMFLARHNINDYSFLIGIHDEEFDYDDALKEKDICVLLQMWSDNCNGSNSSSNSGNKGCGRKPFYERYFGGMKSNDGKKVYFFGIIDIFTSYNHKKKMEYMMKSISQGNGISCKPPNDYVIRFKEYLKKIFNITDTDL
jgi:1-phosphatidylinositol-4-phosphate 5-kinase